MKKNVLISTGGSGGHVIPAIILHEHLSDERNVILSSDKRGLKYFDNSKYKFKIINTPKMKNIFFFPFNLIIILFLILKSFFLIKKNKIEEVFSTGGYMSLPVILAARFLNLNIYLIEPNLVLGRANRYFLKDCKNIFCYTDQIKNFPDNFKNKMSIISPLVRKHVYKLKSTYDHKNKFTLLIVGGSQGANVFDKSLKNSIVNISKKIPIRVIQQTSEKNIHSLSQFYSNNNIENKIFCFDKNLSKDIQSADLSITRAGASTLAELSLINTPFIAIPLPTSKDNHQFENANFYKKKNCCWIIEQHDFDEKIEDILRDLILEKSDYLKKKENLKKINYQNTWINVNQKILKTLNEN